MWVTLCITLFKKLSFSYDFGERKEDWGRERGKVGEREDHQFVVSLIYAFVV